MRLWSAAAVALALAAAASSFLPSAAHSNTLTQLDPSNLYDEVAKTDQLVIFFAPWCGHCSAFMPKMEEVAASMKQAASKTPKLGGSEVAIPARMGFAAVNCEEHKPLCQEFGVEGYPTVLLLSGSSPEEVQGKAHKFRGPRSAKGVREFVQRVTRPSSLPFGYRWDKESWQHVLPFQQEQQGAGSVSAQEQAASLRIYRSSKWAEWVKSHGVDKTAFLFFSVGQKAPRSSSLFQAYAALAEAQRDSFTFAEMHLPAEGVVEGSSKGAGGASAYSLSSLLQPVLEESGLLSSAVAEGGPGFSCVVRLEFPTASLKQLLPRHVELFTAAAEVLAENGSGRKLLESGLVSTNVTLPPAKDAAAGAAAGKQGVTITQHNSWRMTAEPSCKGPSSSSPRTASEDSGSSSGSASASQQLCLASLKQWSLFFRYPSFPEITPENFASLAHNEAQAYLALAVIDEAAVRTYVAAEGSNNGGGNGNREAAGEGGAAAAASTPSGTPPPSVSFYRGVQMISTLAPRSLVEAEGAALSPLAPSLRRRFLFAWLDARKDPGFLEQFGLKAAEAPQLLVLDSPSKRFWHDPKVREAEDMESFLEEVVRGVAPVQRQGVLAGPQKLINSIGLLPAVLLALLAASLVGWIVWKLVISELLGGGSSSGSNGAVTAPEGGEERSKSSKGSKKASEESAGLRQRQSVASGSGKD